MSPIDHRDFKNVHGKPVHSVILVTGATGHVGRHVVTQLLRTGAVVRALAREDVAHLLEFAKLAGACGTLRAHDSLSFLPTAGYEARWL